MLSRQIQFAASIVFKLDDLSFALGRDIALRGKDNAARSIK